MKWEKNKIKKRGGCLSVFLIYIVIFNFLGIVGYTLFKDGYKLIKQEFPLTPNWGIAYLTIACFVNIIAGWGVWNWKKWGFYLLVGNLSVSVFYQFAYAPRWIAFLVILDLVLSLILVIPVLKKME